MELIPYSWGSLREHGDPDRPGPYPHGQGKGGRPTPVRVKTLDEAVALIAKGTVVELTDVRQVNTLIRKLAQIALDAKARGEKAPYYDLCKVSVAGTNLFCAETIGVPRPQMPQFGGVPRPGSPADKLPRNPGRPTVDGADAFIAHLKTRGIATTPARVTAASLKASQADLLGVKVAEMMTAKGFDPGAKRLFISRDNYVVDGHHRWAAIVGLDAEDGTFETQLNVVRIDAPISEILFLGRAWAKDFGITPKGFD